MLPDRLSTTATVAVMVGATVWLSFGVLAVVGDGTRIGVLPPVWLLASAILVAGAAAVAFRLSWQAALPLGLCLLVLLPWIPLPVPALFLIWTGPAVLLVWGGIALSMVAVAAGAGGASAPAVFSDARRAPRVAAVALPRPRRLSSRVGPGGALGQTGPIGESPEPGSPRAQLAHRGRSRLRRRWWARVQPWERATRWLDWSAPLVDLPRALPSFFRAGGGGVRRAPAMIVHLVTPAILWSISLLVGWILLRLLAARRPGTVPVRAVATSCVLLTVLALGANGTWSFVGGTHTTATRSQLRLLRSDNPEHVSYGVRLPATRVLPAAEARAHLALSTSRLDDAPPGALLLLGDVPPGDYQLRVKRAPSAQGEFFVGIGRATAAACQGSLSDGSADTLSFLLGRRSEWDSRSRPVCHRTRACWGSRVEIR